MPYFVYKIDPGMKLTHLDTKERYQEARVLVRGMRAEKAADDAADYRLIFARHQADAEKLLSTPRDERVIGED